MRHLLLFLIFYSCQQIPASIDDLVNQYETPTLQVSEVKLENFQVIDARSEQEYQVSHIEGALHYPYQKDVMILVKKLISNKPVLVYCSVGQRSGILADQLLNRGFKVYHLYGGIFAWHNTGKPIFDSSKNQTQKIHGYNKKWSVWIKHGDIVY